MADGELAAVFKGLAVDAEQAGGEIADSMASVVEQTADIEDGNIARTLATEEENARSFSNLMADEPPGVGSLPGSGATEATTGGLSGTERVIRAQSGIKGNWNKLLNNLEPNATYVVDDQYTYVTDDLGRVTQSRASLNKLVQSPARNNYQQKVAGGVDRLLSDQGGHILGAQFGAPGEAVNLTAMNKLLNLKDYKSMETSWANAIRQGQKVDTNVTIAYTGDSLRPIGYKVTYTIDGKAVTRSFRNS